MSIIDLRDFEYLQSQVLEEYELFNAWIPYYRVNKSATTVDTLYKEHTGTLVYSAPITLPVYVDHKPKLNILIRYGFDQDRDFMIYISTSAWDKYVALGDPTVVPEIGDKIVFDNIDFRVMSVKPISYFANYHLGDTDSAKGAHAFYECHVRRIRPGEE